MERKRTSIACLIIAVTYAVGIAGFRLEPLRPLFLILVPYHLLLVFGLLLWTHRNWNVRFGLFLALVFVLSFLAEWIGVHTGWLFGHYSYGQVLGLKVAETPLIIGINWLMLVYSSYTFADHFVQKPMLKVLLAAFLMVGLDFLIEPVAIQLGFWEWQNGDIPLYNYVCWFVVALFLHVIALKLRVQGNLSSSICLFTSQMIFFLFMNDYF